MTTEYHIEPRHSYVSKKNRSRANQTSTDEKKKLVRLVRERELLWNLKHPLYKDARAHNKCWLQISDILDKPKNICKISWKALLDSYRYRKKVAQKLRDQGEIEDPKKYIEENFEFAEELAFLPKITRPKNRYIKIFEGEEDYDAVKQERSSANSFTDIEECTIENDPIKSDDSRDATNYSEENMEEDVVLDENEQSAVNGFDSKNIVSESKSDLKFDDVVCQLGKLVLAQTELVREFKDSVTGKLTFKTQLTAVDALLQQLPKNQAEKTLVEMQNYVLKKINEHQREKWDTD